MGAVVKRPWLKGHVLSAPLGETRRQATQGGRARGAERGVLRALDQLPVERTANGPAPKEHGLELLPRREWEGTIKRIHHALYVAVRAQAGREASPTTAIDSQMAKAAQTYGPPPPASGFLRPGPGSLRQRIRSRGTSPGQDGDPRVPSLPSLIEERCAGFSAIARG